MLSKMLCVRAPVAVRFPPQTFRVTTIGRMACSARQLVASNPGQYRNVNIAFRSRTRWLRKRRLAGERVCLSSTRSSRASSCPRATASPCGLIWPWSRRSRSRS